MTFASDVAHQQLTMARRRRIADEDIFAKLTDTFAKGVSRRLTKREAEVLWDAYDDAMVQIEEDKP